MGLSTDNNAAGALGAEELLALGRDVVRLEAEALLGAADRLGNEFVAAVNRIACAKGRVVVTGLGKSGHIARKLAATFSSTGTPAYFLHPSEALHGDLGIVREDDVMIAIAYGGETQEVLEVARHAKRMGIAIIAISGEAGSTLARLADHFMDGSVAREACPHRLAPTASSTLALALGDALAMGAMQAKGFTESDFANVHPGGSLGRKLQRVFERMIPLERLVVVSPDASFEELVNALNAGGIGHVAIVDPSTGDIAGGFTDGDLRRLLIQHAGHIAVVGQISAERAMRPGPAVIEDGDVIANALNLMEKKQISGLFVVRGDSRRLCGFLHLKDLIASKVL